MARTIGSLIIGMALFGAAGCREFSPPIQLKASSSDLAVLAGDWHGEYVTSGSPRRHGSITFSLEAGAETASGAVVMIPDTSHQPYERYRSENPVIAGREFSLLSEVLSITIVRIEENMVRGELDPYWDPDRQCIAYTRFYGFIQGRDIDGTFRTTFSAPYLESTGTWHVTKAATR